MSLRERLENMIVPTIFVKVRKHHKGESLSRKKRVDQKVQKKVVRKRSRKELLA